MRTGFAGAIALATAAVAVAGGAGEISDAHRQAIEELLEVTHVESSIRNGVPAMADAMIVQNPSLAPYRDVIVDWAEEFMTWEVFGPRYVEMYADVFTEQELRELTRFYQTPIGQKTLDAMPELMERGAILGNDVAMKHTADLQARLEAAVAERQEP